MCPGGCVNFRYKKFMVGYSFASRGAEMSAKVFFTTVAGMVCYKGQQMFSGLVT
jgi:hypothetical protein